MRESVTCRLNETASGLRQKLEAAGEEVAIVVDPHHVVLGRVRLNSLKDAATPNSNPLIEELMDADPATIRPDVTIADVVESFQKRRGRTFLVTTLDGELMGVLHREDAERRLHELHSSDGAAAYHG
jgi:Mg/Co/Ni transporter MgtE